MAGLLGGRMAMNGENEEIRADLVREAQRGAAIFSAEELSILQGSRADLQNPLYRDVKGRLARYRGADTAVRFFIFSGPMRKGSFFWLIRSPIIQKTSLCPAMIILS